MPGFNTSGFPLGNVSKRSSGVQGNLPGTGTLIQDTGFIPVSVTSWTVPRGASWVDVICVGAGGGQYIVSANNTAYSGGGAAIARSGIPVTAGSVLGLSIGVGVTQKNDGAGTSVTYQGQIIAYADGGRSASSTSGGSPGLFSNCIFLTEAMSGTPGTISPQNSNSGGTVGLDTFGISRIGYSSDNPSYPGGGCGGRASASGNLSGNGAVILRFTSY